MHHTRVAAALASPLREAISVLGERGTTHGDYVALHTRIAHLWAAYLQIELRAEQVAGMMMLLKLARSEIAPSHDDHVVDAAGYLAIYGALQKNDRATSRVSDDGPIKGAVVPDFL